MTPERRELIFAAWLDNYKRFDFKRYQEWGAYLRDMDQGVKAIPEVQKIETVFFRKEFGEYFWTIECEGIVLDFGRD